MFPRNENRSEGTFAKTTLLETALLSPNDPFLVVRKRVVSKRVVSADVPPERKPERGYVRQNHPFTKPPFYLPVTFPFPVDTLYNLHRECQNKIPKERQKDDNDNVCLHLWELQMSHLKYLLHCGRQKHDNTSATKMLHRMHIWVVVVALGLVLK